MSNFDEQIMDLGGKAVTYAEVRKDAQDLLDLAEEGRVLRVALQSPQILAGAMKGLSSALLYFMDQLQLAQAGADEAALELLDKEDDVSS